MQKKRKSVKAELIEQIGDGTHATRNIELERSLLRTCLSNHDKLRLSTSILSPDHFADPRHKVIFKTAIDLDKAGKAPYPNIVEADILRRPNDDIDPGDFRDAMVGIAASDHADIESASEMIRDLYSARKLQSISHEVVERASAGESIHELIDELESSIRGIHTSATGREHLGDLDDVAGSLTRGYQSIIVPDSSGIRTPWPALNDVIYGLRKGEVTVIGARPGVGKSALLGQIAYHAARQGELTLFYAHEMSAESMWRRIMCTELSIRNTDVNQMQLTAEEVSRCEDWMHNDASRFLHISDRGGKTPAAVRADLIRKKSKYGKVGLVVIDYLQLMQSGKGHIKRYEEVTDISRSLKHIAKELEVPIVMASSMNREQEKRAGKDKRPQLSDLNESGNIEADASIVICPWRPSMSHTGNTPPPDDEMVIVKNRDGRTMSIKTKYRGEFYRFDSVD